MFCKNCGEEINDEICFCPQCGCEVSKKENRPVKKEKIEKKDTKKKSKIWRVIPVLLVVIGLPVFCVLRTNAKEKEYAEKVERAREYVREENYKDAIKNYRNAIEIIPDKDTAYLELAEIYEIQEEPEKTLEILREADECVEDNSKIEKKVEEVETVVANIRAEEVRQKNYENLYNEFVSEVLISKYGEAKIGEMSSECAEISETDVSNAEKPEEAFGVIAEYRTDLNNDDIPELIVLRAEEEDADILLYTGFIYIHVYTIENDEVVELAQPSRQMRYSTLQMTDSGNLHVFVKEENEQKYICVLNCMRSERMQLQYFMYVDLFQVEGSRIVCKKSVTSDYTYIYDTTNVPIEENYTKQKDERDVIYEELYQSIPYVNTIEQFKAEFDEYFDLGEDFVIELSKDAAGHFGYMEIDEDSLPYDFMYSDKLDQSVELLRLRAEWIMDWSEDEFIQKWTYFSDVN